MVVSISFGVEVSSDIPKFWLVIPNACKKKHLDDYKPEILERYHMSAGRQMLKYAQGL